MSIVAYDIHGIEYGSNDLGEIRVQQLGRNIERMLGVGSGEVERQMTGVVRSNPAGKFTTQAIGTALGFVGVNGAVINTSNLLTLWRKAFKDGGTRQAAASSLHDKIVIADGLIVPDTLSAAHNSDAALSYNFWAADINGDGTSPITVTPLQALTGTTNHDEFYRLGPLTINGTVIDNVQSVDIDFGHNIIVNEGDGKIFPTGIAISQTLPTVRFTTFDAAIVALVGETGLAISASDVIIKLRKVNKNAAVSYTVGYQFTVNDGLVQLDDYSGSHAQQGLFSAQVIPAKEGSLDLLVGATF